MTGSIPIQYFLIISTLMFFIGIYGFLTRKNLITMLMSIELILNSVNINFVTFNKYLTHKICRGISSPSSLLQLLLQKLPWQ